MPSGCLLTMRSAARLAARAGVLRQTVTDFVMVALVGHEDVRRRRQAARLIEAAGQDGGLGEAVVLPEQGRPAMAAESPARKVDAAYQVRCSPPSILRLSSATSVAA